MNALAIIPGLLGETVMAALANPDVMDIIVNSDGTLIVDDKQRGKQVAGRCDLQKVGLAMRIFCQYRGCFLNTSQPTQVLQLPISPPWQGARMRCLIPPAATAPTMVIRRHAKQHYPLSDFIEKGMLSAAEGVFLRECIATYRNICVVGITQSGKTALTSALINEIRQMTPNDRLLILETTPEISISSEDVQRLQTGPLSMQALVASTLQMRPDRLIIGEVTDHAAHDMLKAWQVGCAGGICTFHAKDCEAAPLRLAELCREKGIAPPYALINSVVDVIVHMVRDAEHPAGRRVKAIATLTGVSEAGQPTLEFFNVTNEEKPVCKF